MMTLFRYYAYFQLACAIVESLRLNALFGQHFKTSELMKKINIAAAISVTTITCNTLSAFGADVRLVGDIPTSGLIFKDSLKISAFRDPKIEVSSLLLIVFINKCISILH